MTLCKAVEEIHLETRFVFRSMLKSTRSSIHQDCAYRATCRELLYGSSRHVAKQGASSEVVRIVASLGTIADISAMPSKISSEIRGRDERTSPHNELKKRPKVMQSMAPCKYVRLVGVSKFICDTMRSMAKPAKAMSAISL